MRAPARRSSPDRPASGPAPASRTPLRASSRSGAGAGPSPATGRGRCGNVASTRSIGTGPVGRGSRASERPFCSPATVPNATTTEAGTSSSEAAQRKARRIRLTRALIEVLARPAADHVLADRSQRQRAELLRRSQAVELPDRPEGHLEVAQLLGGRPVRGGGSAPGRGSRTPGSARTPSAAGLGGRLGRGWRAGWPRGWPATRRGAGGSFSRLSGEPNLPR